MQGKGKNEWMTRIEFPARAGQDTLPLGMGVKLEDPTNGVEICSRKWGRRKGGIAIEKRNLPELVAHPCQRWGTQLMGGEVSPVLPVPGRPRKDKARPPI